MFDVGDIVRFMPELKVPQTSTVIDHGLIWDVYEHFDDTLSTYTILVRNIYGYVDMRDDSVQYLPNGILCQYISENRILKKL